MHLPIRIVDSVAPERLISVDGAWGQPGLNLSHWPGNATPAELRHDLSTGVALHFARLPLARRNQLAAGCVAIANNHVDTDGICALYAVAHPEAALARADRLLEAAAAGDFFRVPSERAFQFDATVAGLYDEARSPWRDRFAGLGDRERRELVTVELVARLADLLDGDLVEYGDLWAPALEALRGDRADLARAQRDELVHLDIAVYTAPEGLGASRAHARVPHFDPGRHALFGATQADRVLAIGPRGAGATYRFLINTTSWFDLESAPRLERPDLARLADRLNALEGADRLGEVAWRAQATASPSPELWFGRPAAALFAEHAPWLETSRLAPKLVKNEIFDALRAAWTFPDA
ncbi:MAG: hypothetical protein NTY35_14390 [Planctomycetota bacterium]|nr:hypothetical protein [Planctomycetota bacterium]